uniref:PPM-type phosphatase domain-containing protein n=1 Tax=Panagrolaimus sp. ES5 TaxID=591445 RepID=A0AC34F2Q0_9BILA
MGFKDLDLGKDQCWHLKHKCFAYCANQGHREYMEDRMHYMHDPANNNLSIFSIFDGHGGKFVSEYLEEHFSRNIRQRILFGIPSRRLSISKTNEPFQDVKEAIVKEVHKIDDEIGRLNPRKTSFTGSTLISAILEHNRFLTVVNVGDSRAVGCDHRGKAVVLSKDHKPSDVDFFTIRTGQILFTFATKL